MFGLFGKGKIKSDAQKRAVSWWKNLTISGIKEQIRTCHFCNKEIPRMKGYLFTPENILNNDKFMENEIKKLEARGMNPEEAQETIWQRMENVYDDWLVCEDCTDHHFI